MEAINVTVCSSMHLLIMALGKMYFVSNSKGRRDRIQDIYFIGYLEVYVK